MELGFDEFSLSVYSALSSRSRLDILCELSKNPCTATDLARKLYLSKSVLSRHLRQLEQVGIIRKSTHPDADLRRQYYSMNVDRAEIFFPHKVYLPFELAKQEIPIGYYSDFSVEPTCGLATDKEIIGTIDDPRSFADIKRVHASLLWFSNGFIEYRIPNPINRDMHPQMLEISAELSSEFPVSNNAWKSDISFIINDVLVGTWTCPGNFSDVRGRLTPQWWNSEYSQYGLLKHLRINTENSGIDGEKLSDVNIEDLHLDTNPFIDLKIGILDDAAHVGGITLFGKAFGNHPQDISVRVYYSQKDS